MRLSFTFATAVLSLISSVAIAHPTGTLGSRAELQGESATGTVPYTNAQRFARGLSPIAPVRRRGGALKPRASPGVCSGEDMHRGQIKITTSDGRIRYILGNTRPPNGALETTDDPLESLEISMDYDGTSPPAYFGIKNVGPHYPRSPFNLGGTLQNPDYYVIEPGSGELVAAAMVSSNPDTPDDPNNSTVGPTTYPSAGDGDHYSQSVIWSLDADNVLKIGWFGYWQTMQAVTLNAVIGGSPSSLYFTANPALAAAQNPSLGLTQATLQFECSIPLD
ncbi:hypothetical protein FRC03_007193 [Tulasnella sp. 419]|nr:hypothetical protein FRC03_007193 [Tulasnella sp. 419]